MRQTSLFVSTVNTNQWRSSGHVSPVWIWWNRIRLVLLHLQATVQPFTLIVLSSPSPRETTGQFTWPWPSSLSPASQVEEKLSSFRTAELKLIWNLIWWRTSSWPRIRLSYISGSSATHADKNFTTFTISSIPMLPVLFLTHSTSSSWKHLYSALLLHSWTHWSSFSQKKVQRNMHRYPVQFSDIWSWAYWLICH